MFDLEELFDDGNDIVDDVCLRLNFPEYFADVGKYSNEKLEEEIARIRQRIRGCSGVMDVFEPYYKEYLVKLLNEQSKREKTQEEQEK